MMDRSGGGERLMISLMAHISRRRGTCSVRLPILSLLIAAALLGEMQAASAQSPTSYPWCAHAAMASPNAFCADGSRSLRRQRQPSSRYGRKNHLFAGSDGGAERWAVVASLLATAKLNEAVRLSQGRARTIV
jgi:hypothetical protein